MLNQNAEYRKVLKGISIFGGVQIVNIIVNIIRSKFIAILLGPAGIGILGLLTTTTNFIFTLSSFGLSTSAVKVIAVAAGAEKDIQISMVVTVVRRLVWITGLFGAVLSILISPWLSEIAFGNRDYTTAFMFISVILLLNQLTIGNTVVLQGLGRLNWLAKTNVVGSIFGLLFVIPLYFSFGTKGIVPGVILTSLISFLVSRFFFQKLKMVETEMSWQKTILMGKHMMATGFLISIGGLLSMGASYFLSSFISQTGGLEQVGLYNAGFAIVNTYVGLIFTSIGSDYYPRLSAQAKSNQLARDTINRQAEISLLLLAPVIIIFLFFSRSIISLLYSNQFIEIETMINWAAVGMLFKATSWSISFLFLAKGDGRIFFWNELIANVYLLVFNILAYHFMGLTGLGFSFLLSYFVYLLQVYIVSYRYYSFSFSLPLAWIFSLQLLLVIIAFIIVSFSNVSGLFSISISIFIASLSIYYSFVELNKRFDFVGVIKKFRSNLGV